MSDEKTQAATCEHCVNRIWICSRRPTQPGVLSAIFALIIASLICAILSGFLGAIFGLVAPAGPLVAAKYTGTIGGCIGLLICGFILIRDNVIGVYLYYAVHRDGQVHVTREMPSHEVASQVIRVAWGGWDKKGAVLDWVRSSAQHTSTGVWSEQPPWKPEARWSEINGVEIRLRDDLDDATPYLAVPELFEVARGHNTRDYHRLLARVIAHLTSHSLTLVEELRASRDKTKSPHAQRAREQLEQILGTIPNPDLAARMNNALDALAEKYRPRPAQSAPSDDPSPPPRAA